MMPFRQFQFLVRMSACMLIAFSGAQVEAADPLDKTSTFAPSVTFSESETDKVTGIAGARVQSTSRSTTATIIGNITGISLASINTATAFALNFGDCAINFTLGDIPTYVPGQTTAFFCWNGWDTLNKPKGTTGVRLTWTTTKLTIVVTMTNEVTRPSPIATTNFHGAVDPGTGGAITLKDSTTVDFSFGAIASTQRKVYFTGKSSVTHVFYNNTTVADEEFDLNTITLSGVAEYLVPSLTLLAPKQSALIGTNVTVTGKSADGHGLDRMLWTKDLTNASSWTDVTTLIITPPADGLWGATTANWSLDLNALPHGITKFWVKAIDESRNESAPLLITLIYPLPTLLAGRWDAALVPALVTSPLRGAVLFNLATNGTCTGTLTLEGTSHGISGSLLPDETLRAVIKRTNLPDIVITGTFSTFAPTDAAAGVIAGAVNISGVDVATFTARRTPWSSVNLAAAALAGRFHVITSRPNEPYGYGYLITTTTRTGPASISGKLPDGAVVTWSGYMSATGSLPVFVRLYGNKGSLSGNPAIAPTTRTVPNAPMKWVRPNAFTDKQFPAGFDLDLTVSGSAYLAPATNTRVMALTSSNPIATATFAPDGLITPSTQAFTVNANNTISMPANSHGLILAVTASTGLWTGSMTASGTTARASIAMLISGNKAWGFYTAPPVTGTTTMRFGSFTVE